MLEDERLSRWRLRQPIFCVVLWRRGPGAPWHVQPHLRVEALAIMEAEKLMRQFGGETAISPCAVPFDEDLKE